MLQATRLFEHELQKIHRPLLKLIKNKADLQVSTSTSLLKHKGLGNYKALADKLCQKQVISLYKQLNSTALSIALLVVLLDKRKKEWVLVENKDNDRRIFKITQKDKAKILGEHYCNILLTDLNQFEIKKCKGYLKQNFGYAAKKLHQGRKEDFELE
ncbi:32992_t:CDS:2 [Gigaspora margarita]|uniref:32992_t:CDS:1 n=1 Tax=Gigaspora margarita TaxID=4874 RepID=A0ABN7VFH8_GIGMA|nr:32992_t:CDS:2 [Gigaspora margarita]